MDIGKLIFSAFRYILLSLDFVVYSLIRVFYNLFMAISEIRLFEGDTSLIETISTRIYALIGVYALFKLTFILINMLINPDTVSDKQKGAGKIVVRVVVMLCLTIAVPWIFDIAYKFQGIILEENIIGTILLGDKSKMKPEDIDDSGKKIANDIFSSFVMIDEGAATYPDNNTNGTESSIEITATECQESYDAIKKLDEGGISSLYSHIDDTYKTNDGTEFCIKYNYIISLIAGGFAAYVFAVYCLDIGLRVAKLAFYELSAPIPIATYIDGKKDGPFNNWVKSAVSTYVDLFIRLLIIYFIILVINKGLPDLLNISDLQKYDFFTRNFAKAIVILGLLMFAAQAPKLIKDLFGIKGDDNGAFGLNLSQKLGKAAVVGGALSAGTAAVGHLAGGAVKAGVSKGGSTIKNRGIQIAANMRDKFKSGGDANAYAKAKEANAKNYGIRQKAASIQALSMLDHKNYDSKTHRYTGVKSRDLAKQALTGNVNASAGLLGMAAAKQSELTSSLSFQTTKNKPQGLKSAGAITANLGNLKINLANDRAYVEEQAKTNPSLYDSLKIRSNFNQKEAFDNYLKSVGIDSTFQNLPKDENAWKEFESKFMGFSETDSAGNYTNSQFKNLTVAEKEAFATYAEKALGDLKKEVDTLSKKK